MLVKITAREAAALIRVKNDADMKGFIQRELEELKKQMVDQRDDITLRQMQGKARYLFELLELIEDSVVLANKLSA